MVNLVSLSPLKFYSSIKKQNRYKSFAYGNTAPLITSPNNISPFQFSVKFTGEAFSDISEVYLYDANTNERTAGGANLRDVFLEAGLSYLIGKDSIYNIIFNGKLPLNTVLKHEGLYYLSIVLKTKEGKSYSFYSEVFCYTNSIDGCIKIEYSHPDDYLYINNGFISFTNGFKFVLYLKTELGKPEYSFEEEVTKRLGYSFIESQVSKKTYKFNCVVPEYICDAMRIIRLCENKKIYYNDDTYEALTFDMSVEWQDQGDLASVSCEFDVDNVIATLGGKMYEPIGGDFYDGDYTYDFKVES